MQKPSLPSLKDLIDVAFEFFDPNPKIDYQAIKRLLSQLFQHDSENLDMHELTELILSQPTVGTTIKTDGIESDPYALMTVLNMHLHHVRALHFLCFGGKLTFIGRKMLR
jgi:protein BCP1